MQFCPPLLFGLGVQLDHMFGSRWLVNQLYRLGFSISHEEVNRYKQSVLQTENFEDWISMSASGFIQWSADNVDHNTVTSDGKNTFHGMGIIASTTLTGDNLVPHVEPVLQQKRVPVQELIKDKGVPIVSSIGPAQPAIRNYVFKPRKELLTSCTLPSDGNCDVLWHTGWLLSKDLNHPNWSGFMQNVRTSIIAEKSDVHLLPIIDLNPSNESCIYSTLLYIKQQAANLNIVTACLTFDQPLWWKAVGIIEAKKMEIVCKLGGFHTLMIFLGSIGSVMASSRLEETLTEIYANNVVPHILSGKAVSRALRGHFLVEAALVKRLTTPINEDMELSDQTEIQVLLNRIMNKEVGVEEVNQSLALQRFSSKLKDSKDHL